MRIDRGDNGEEGADRCPPVAGDRRLDAGDVPATRGTDGNPEDAAEGARRTPADGADAGHQAWVDEHRAKIDAAYRAHAIDRGYERVREIEKTTVTPAMRRIEAEDPDRHLAGLEHRLKGKDRLTEKVEKWMSAQPGLRPNEAFSLVKDAIRYTFVYDEENYTAGVYTDCERLESAGFEPADRENSWANDQYKGINGRWREPSSGILFEVQFHTQASLDAKEQTHPAYERIRDVSTPPGEVKQLKAYQREVCAKIPIPTGATEVPDYNYL